MIWGRTSTRATVRAKGKHSERGVEDHAEAVFSLPLEPKADFDKTITDVTANGDGSFSAVVTLDALNVGNEKLVRLQFKDDLDIFGTGELVEVGTVEVLDGELTLNPGFDGLSDIRLLAGSDRLLPGERARLRFSITFDPATEPGPFENCALIWARGKHSETDVDFYDCAEIGVPPVPEAEFEKTISDVIPNTDGTFSAVVTLDALNVGNDKLVRLQFKDDLDIFGTGELVEVGTVEVLDGELTLNPGFDGLSDIRLLAGSDRLLPGERARLRFSITFDPATEPGPFENCALIWARGKHSETDVDFYDCAEIIIPPKPSINIDKQAGVVSAESDGNFTVPVTLTVSNVGNEALINLQIVDSLDIFGAGQLVAVENIDSPTLSLNAGYDGITSTGMLTGLDGLAPGTQAMVTFVVRFNPGPEPGPFVNEATATATGGISGDPVSDHDDASFLAIPTEPNPAISVDKQAGNVVDNGDATFSVPMTIVVTNTGDEVLADLQLEDSLDIFGAGQLVAIESFSSSSLSLNPNYDGLADTVLLTGTDRLPLATAASLTFTLRFDPASEPGPFINVVTATANGEISADPVSDFDDASFLAMPAEPNPAISVDKVAGQVSAEADGNFTVPITITLTNIGDEILNDIQIADSLDIFGAGQLIAVENLASTSLNVNTAYDGLTDTDLLTGNDSLLLADTGSVTFDIRFNPGPEPGPFVNEATATATGGISGDPVSDRDDASFLAIPTEPNPAIAVDKQAGSVVDNGDATFSVPMVITVTNSGNEDLTNLQLTDPLNIFGSGRLIAVENVTSPSLSINPAYDGVADAALLTATDSLPVTTVASISFTLRFDPGSEPGPFINVVTADASGEISGDPVSDDDDASFLAMPAQPDPTISVDKVAGQVSAEADGNFTVPITITVTNVGSEVLSSIQINDSLDIFGAGQLIAVENLASTSFSVNPAYDGLTENDLLTGNDVLALASSGSVTFDIRFNPGPEPGPFLNVAAASGIGGISGDPVADTDDASFLATPTEPNPAITVDKQAGNVVDNGDATFSVPMTIVVTNTGNEVLADLQLEDSLDIFGAGQLLAIENLTSATLATNMNFDGLTDQNLLAGSDSLALAGTGTVTFTLRFNPQAEPGPFTNVVIATAAGELTGVQVSDSDDAPFLARATEPNPAIDVEKSVGEVVDNDDGTFTVAVTATVTNVGDEVLAELQLEDPLDIFGAGNLISVQDLVSDTLSINPNFDGLSDANLLLGTDMLPLATSATVTFLMQFDPASEPGPFTNRVTAMAVSEITAVPVSDDSDATFEPPLPPDPPTDAILVVKSADRRQVMRGENVSYEIAITNLTENPIASVAISDHPPVGFQLVEDSGVLVRAGADAMLYTADDIVAPIASSGHRPLMFEPFDLGPLERVAVRYLMRVSVGVVDGEYFNSVTVSPDPFSPVTSSTPVTVFGDPIFEQTTLIGKVFDDWNDNGNQDEDEPGIPGVRLATVSGLTVETDSEGRYHLADVSVGRFDRGANFIIKLDEASLPAQTEVLGENPRVVRLTQATMTKVNFSVKLPRPDANLVDPQQCDDATANRLRSRSGSSAASSCDVGEIVETSSSTAIRITVSGGTFGCNRLAADTLPGRLSGQHSEVIVYGDPVAVEKRRGEPRVCKPPIDDESAIEVGKYPLELTTMNGTRLRITATGDVVRMEDPDNDEHIIVTPFRDDSDSTVVTALRVINDGRSPEDEAAAGFAAQSPQRDAISGHGDQLVVDPRLDVLAMNRPSVDDKGKLTDSIEFKIYSNYPAFINGYRLEVYGRVANRPRRELLFSDEFTQYRYNLRRRFDGIGHDLSRYDELAYQLKASNCPFPLDDEKDCYVDVTVERALSLDEAAESTYVHLENELWGQSSLVDQRIPIQGGRVRISGKAQPGIRSVQRNHRDVPVSADGTFVLEEHLPAEAVRQEVTEVVRTPPLARVISADAMHVRVSGGQFGCGEIVVPLLGGRQKNEQMQIRAATITADPARAHDATTVCRRPPNDPCKTSVKPGEISVTSDEGSCFIITRTGDVLSDAHPHPDDNRQQLAITPFRDETDNSKVTALRIANEGTPGESLLDPGSTEVMSEIPAEDYWFTVAIANLTVGQNNVSGNRAPLAADAHFDGSTYTDGRIAFFTKGRIDEKYLVTAQLDSTEDELQNFTDNLKRKDPRRIFRQLDPNRYFPTYGDDSVTTTDVDTQGAFYARVDWDKSTALWGNFNTGLTDTEFMQYNRSLYGLKLKHESLDATEFGSSKSKLTLFGSEAQSAAAQVTFRATGGSLYYLRDTDIVQGSEKVWVEVRRRDTEQVVERTILLEGRDYEIDAIQGRIILRRPLSQVVNDRERSIIRSSPLEGDEVFLLVDYEYVPLAFAADAMTYGGRGQVWLGDHFAIGATSVADERDNTDYALQGVDLTLQYTENSYLRAEFAESDARQNNANFISGDGGLSFNSQVGAGFGESLNGDALALEARIDFADFSDSLDGDIRAWSKSREAEFSTGRLGQGVDVNDRGVELHADLGDHVVLTAAHTDLELELASRQQVSRVQLDGDFGELDVGIEVRHEDIELQSTSLTTPESILNGTSGEGEALLVGARVGYALDTNTSIYASGQTVADDKGVYKENDLFTLGVNTKLRDDLGINLEASDGDRGSAMIAGVDYATKSGLNFQLSGGVGSGAINQFATRYEIGEGHELYGSYAIDPDRTDTSRNLLTLGQRRSFGNGIGLFTESQFGKDDRYASVGHVFGLDFEGVDDWRFNASMQKSENEGLGLLFDRSVLSLGAYRNAGDMKLSTRLEYREDEGSNVHNRQYVSTSSFNKVVNEDRRWLGQLNVSWTDDLLNGGHDARFVELDIGHAVRPADNDKFNLIARYSFLYDLPTEGQATIRPDERSHLLSLEGIYDFDNRWELAAKAAIRKGEQRSVRDMGPWQDFGLRMASLRARYQVSKSWDGVAEYRWLSDIDGDNERHGVLLTLYRQVGDNLKVGVGFNFADFNDTLRIDDYDNRGWFVDLIGMY